MIDFVDYVVSELKSQRLSKSDSLALIKQFSSRSTALLSTEVLHPLVHCNTSDLMQHSYGIRFSGREFFLQDHRINGRMVLPGAVFLEMIRAAIFLAIPENGNENPGDRGVRGLEILNLAWSHPVLFPEHRRLSLSLFPLAPAETEGESIEFEVSSALDTLHCHGQARVRPLSQPPRLNLDALAARMDKERMEGIALYATMARLGVELGPAHQGVASLLIGEGELLVHICLPEKVRATKDEYGLHPSLVDSCLQAAMALLVAGKGGDGPTPIPFALETLRVFDGCTPEMTAWVRINASSEPEDRTVKLDIDLCDSFGNVRVQMQGFSARMQREESRALASAKSEEPVGCVLAAPCWQETALNNKNSASGFARRYLLFCGFHVVETDTFAAALDARVWSFLEGSEGGTHLAEDYTAFTLACFEQIQEILRSKPAGKVLVQVVTGTDPEQMVFCGLSGLLRTAGQENPLLVGQVLSVDPHYDEEALLELLHREGLTEPDPMVRYEHGKRQRLAWQILPGTTKEIPQHILDDHGVYLITGGLGGLGRLFAREILARTSGAKVLLTGRRPLTAEKRALLADLDDGGERVFYRVVDLLDLEQTTRAIRTMYTEFGRLDGILHSAGMVLDNFILKKSSEAVSQVLGPKVTGTVHLDAATKDIDLTFFALFSSAVSMFGNAGQADYAAANGFMDWFALWRNSQIATGRRKGRTVALNWPLWQEGGMRIDPANEAILRRSVGMQAMHTTNGMAAFHRSLKLAHHQLLVMEGNVDRIRLILSGEQPAATRSEVSRPIEGLFDKAETYLQSEFAKVLKLAPQKLDPQSSFERYGIDSILAMELTTQLEAGFGSLPKTLFFEYQSIHEMAGYFVDHHAAQLARLVGGEARNQDHISAPSSSPPIKASSGRGVDARRSTNKLRIQARTLQAAVLNEPIAIVGLSGRYPESPNLESFWDNLRDGKDCIVEIPAERWNWREYYSEDRTAAGHHYSKWGGFISGVDEFDPLFFNIPPVEAAMIDPQERLFLQHAWMAIEDAGYTRATLQHARLPEQEGQVGVYVGVMYGEYQLLGAESSLLGKRMGIPVSYASIANRVSYFLNLHGPSMTLDTMCSSSLTAIHLACLDLKQGRTSMALAGGVNVTIHPNKYHILSSGQFISSDGHCQSFGIGGDGYIPGEGVGVAVLKRLSDAERDGNHIYGLIRGSALNHGGKTTGYSVPNPKAQAAVIGQAFRAAGVDARQVSYIEAHGTGTKLGDPIEIAALTQLFRQTTDERQFCAIGSAKSNIGHCESAAGIAGLTKILLQMRHRMLVPSLHSATLNPYIDFAASPFTVNQSLQPWQPPTLEGQTVPRIAGLSSFGAGGANAHMVVEEYQANRRPFLLQDDGAGEWLILLSARTKEQLHQKAKDLRNFFAAPNEAVDLSSLAYTLQVGREAMAHRLACIISSVEELMAKLESYCANEQALDQIFTGQVSAENEGWATLVQDEDMREALSRWLERRKYAKLAEAWVRGLELDWSLLYDEGHRPRLMSLPVYPFARERYWVKRPESMSLGQTGRASFLHPLVQVNASDLYQQRYLAAFTGREFFLEDHQLETAHGTRVKMLPGVAMLEMARAAVAFALPHPAENRRMELKNVVWMQPVAVDEQQQLAIHLWPVDASTVDFTIVRDASGDDPPTIHCQGRVTLSPWTAPPHLDKKNLARQMRAGTVEGTQLYPVFSRMGLHYGSSFRCLRRVHQGKGQLLAELSFAGQNSVDKGDFVLHPGVLDSALQSAIGLVGDMDALPSRPPVPFALDSLVVHGPCDLPLWAWVRYAPDTPQTSDLSVVDLDLFDEHGKVRLQIRGLSSRTMAVQLPANSSGVLLATPQWEPLAPGADNSSGALRFGRHLILLCDLPQVDPQQLRTLLAPGEVQIITFQEQATGGGNYLQAAALSFQAVRALLEQNHEHGTLLQFAVGYGQDKPFLAGLAGLIDTARLEQPRLIGQMLLCEQVLDAKQLAGFLEQAGEYPAESRLLCADGKMTARRWQRQAFQSADKVFFRNRGIYLLTGGLGGLGLLFAREILSRGEETVVILTGRSAGSEKTLAACKQLTEELAIAGDRVVYRKLDLTSEAEVSALVAQIVADFGGLHGILHCAGMIRDSLMVNKSSAEFLSVLEPKVLGTQYLDTATQAIELDFWVLFSSVASVVGNVGQADYAVANGFMDSFASWRNRLVSLGQRYGATVSINWPLWQEGGMQLDDEARQRLEQSSGMIPLQTAHGLKGFSRALELGSDNVLLIEGDVNRLKQALNQRRVPVELLRKTGEGVSAGDTAGEIVLLDQVQDFLLEEFSALLRIPVHEIEVKVPLEQYGLDSVLAMRLTNQLEHTFGPLSKTLLFEYQTIQSLAGYLAKAFPSQISKQAQKEYTLSAAPGAVPADQAMVNPRFMQPASSTKLKLRRMVAPHADAEDAVAIIGMGGRYPLADTLAEFWENLKNGRDCITEIPAERWDYRRFFTHERNRPGTSYSKWGGFLRNIDRFDALFFNISPKEAELIDPQERLFLETAWETIEEAGYSKESLGGRRIGVYVGVMWGQYELYGLQSADGSIPGSSFASIANRVSYFFNFQGPSLAVDTMCSSSLTAIHLACEEIRQGGVEAALAGGVNVSLHPNKYLNLSQGNFASSDGRCRSFGQGGDGYVPGEGVGAVLLKSLSRALRDGDHIHGVIRASSINHGGKTNGYTVPNPVAQGDLIAEVLRKAAIDPASIGYVEAHGTGTALGDPIEITGLVRAFDAEEDQPPATRQSCALGSVKSNIGHLESAAGIAALSKVLLQFRYRQLVPSLHAETLNTHIDFSQTPFAVQRRLEDWPSQQGHPRRAGVSAFGAGGANAHLLVEEFVENRQHQVAPSQLELILFSARTKTALLVLAEKMLDHLATATEQSLADIAFTTQVGRTPLPERLAIIAVDKEELRRLLHSWLSQPSKEQGQEKREGAEKIFAGSTGKGRRQKKEPNRDLEHTASLQQALVQGELAELALHWVTGGEIDWTQLHRGVPPHRCSLPTYPFERERYWLETMPTPGLADSVQPRAQMLAYRSQWNPRPLPPKEYARIQGNLLFLGDAAQLLDACRENIDGVVVAVGFGRGYQCLDAGQYLVNPNQTQDIDRLVDDLVQRGWTPATIVHALDNHTTEGSAGLPVETGLFVLHDLCQAFLKRRVWGAIRLVSCSSAGGGEYELSLYQALAGYLKSLAQEQPQCAWKVVTLDNSITTGYRVHCFLEELTAPNGWNQEIFLSMEGACTITRQVRELVLFPESQMVGQDPWKQGGVYLVTGGMGGLGFIISRHLASRYGAKLVLTGRSPADAAIQNKLDVLQQEGGQALYVQADMTQSEHVAQAIAAAKRHFSHLNGIIHSAGINRDAFILHKTREEMAAVLAAKVEATVHLDQATKNEQLDLFVLFSSAAGEFGNPGQADYAFANAFLDRFAEKRQVLVARGERFGHTVSINWPFWEEGGMQLSLSDIELSKQRTGLVPLPTAAGLRSWDLFVQSKATQILALYGEADKITAFLAHRLSDISPPAAHTETVFPTDNDRGLREAVELYLKSLLSEQIKLAVDRIDTQESFAAFGVDSMMISRINAALERDLGELPKTLLYEYQTIEELADHLLHQVYPALLHFFAASPPGGTDTSPAGKEATEKAAAQPVSGQQDVHAEEPIAIVGLHGLFPGSESLAAFWHNLREGRDLTRLVPEDRWDWTDFYDADPEKAKDGAIYCKWGGFLEHVADFDAAFFNITADDARMIDPQERLFLQSVWAALEDAGYTRASLKKRYPRAKSADVGVFVGVTTNSYHQLTPEEWSRGNMVNPGAMPWSIANRVSYFFDFQGPSLPVDTACSSSLVALHLACRSLRQGECQLAIAGGVNLYLHPAKYQSLCRRRMLAVHGQCRSYGAGDDGFIPGEGIGSMVLKPLSRAMADRDHIYAVVVGSGCSHAGQANSYSAPNPNAQADLIEQTLAQAAIAPETIGYVEGHGTGTQLGDSLEVVAMTKAFRRHTQEVQYCALGSVKANIGHGESAAGMAGVAKILLQFKHKEIAPTIHVEEVNPSIDFVHSPFFLQRNLTAWKTPVGHPRRAMINSFGAGGVNACLVLEAHKKPAQQLMTADGQGYLILLSARDTERLQEYAGQLHDFLCAEKGVDMGRLAYTLQVGREAMKERFAVVVADVLELMEELAVFVQSGSPKKGKQGRVEMPRGKREPSQEQLHTQQHLFDSGNLMALAAMWLQGQVVDWEVLYGLECPSRLSLPTYPFARQRFWVSDTRSSRTVRRATEETAQSYRLHPLVTRNVSTLKEVRFVSKLSEGAYYAQEHRINGESLFPGAGFLEIACITGAIAAEAPILRLTDIVWPRPLVFTGEPQLVQTRLKANGNHSECSIITFNDDNEPVVHAEARVFCGSRNNGTGEKFQSTYSLAELKQMAKKSIAADQCYQRFSLFGFSYGPAFRTIEELRIGEGMALSRLVLKEELHRDFDQYILHPCLIDGALQTVIGIADGEGSSIPHLPFAVDEVELVRPLSHPCYVYVEHSESDGAENQMMKQFHIRLLNEKGEVLVRINNFYVRALTREFVHPSALSLTTQ